MLALFGAGWQARSQLEAVCAVRPIREVRVFSRTPERLYSLFQAALRVRSPEPTIGATSGADAPGEGEALRHLSNRDVNACAVYVEQTNERAVALYWSKGFSPAPRTVAWRKRSRRS